MLKWLKAFGAALGIMTAVVGFMVLLYGLATWWDFTVFIAVVITFCIVVTTYVMHETL